VPVSDISLYYKRKFFNCCLYLQWRLPIQELPEFIIHFSESVTIVSLTSIVFTIDLYFLGSEPSLEYSTVV
jgi:hypothetical protein